MPAPEMERALSQLAGYQVVSAETLRTVRWGGVSLVSSEQCACLHIPTSCGHRVSINDGEKTCFRSNLRTKL